MFNPKAPDLGLGIASIKNPLVAFALNAGVIDVDYILEVRDDSGLKGLIPFPTQPFSFTTSGDFFENPIFTLDQTQVSREVSRLRKGTAQLFGFSRLYTYLGIDAKGNLVNTKGENHLRNFEKFIEDYMKSIEDGGSQYLVLRALKEDLHVKVAIQNFMWTRSAKTSRFTYEWNMTLKIYDSAKVTDNPFEFDILNNFEDIVVDGINAFTGVLDATSGAIAGTIGQATGMTRSILKAAEGAVDATQDILDLPNTVAEGVRGLAVQIQSLWNKTMSLNVAALAPRHYLLTDQLNSFDERLHAAQKEKAELAEIAASGEGANTELGTTSAALMVADIMYQMFVLEGYLGRVNRRTFQQAELKGFLGSETGYNRLAQLLTSVESVPVRRTKNNQSQVQYVLRSGENLLNIAHTFLGDTSRWHELAEINDYKDAHTKRNGDRANTGDRIYIPLDTDVLQQIQSSDNQSISDSIGTDLQVVDGDLVLGEDLKLVSGDDNVIQFVTTRVKTIAGEITTTPQYGGFPLVGARMSTQTSLLYSALIREELLKDVRITDVSDISFVSESDYVDIQFSVQPLGSESITFRAPLEVGL